MDCEQVARKIDAYLDGELGEDDSGRLTEHLAECRRCSAQFGPLLQVVQVLDAVPELRAPDELTAEVLRRLPAYQPGVGEVTFPAPSAATVRWVLGSLGAVASAAIIAGLAWVGGANPRVVDIVGGCRQSAGRPRGQSRDRSCRDCSHCCCRVGRALDVWAAH